MSKQITPNEISTIIRSLLVDPDSVGELCEKNTYDNFRCDLVQQLRNYQLLGAQPEPQTNEQLADVVETALRFSSSPLPSAELINFLNLMTSLGELIADYCGGQVSPASAPDFYADQVENGDDDDFWGDATKPLLSVSANDSLPDIDTNIWSAYDLEGEL